MEKIEQLHQQLATALQGADQHMNVGNIGDVNHRVKPLAYETAKQNDPVLMLVQENISNFKRQYGREPALISMPMEMLMHMLAMLPKSEQDLFWVSDTKRLSGMEVKLSQDGALRFY